MAGFVKHFRLGVCVKSIPVVTVHTLLTHLNCTGSICVFLWMDLIFYAYLSPFWIVKLDEIGIIIIELSLFIAGCWLDWGEDGLGQWG